MLLKHPPAAFWAVLIRREEAMTAHGASPATPAPSSSPSGRRQEARLRPPVTVQEHLPITPSYFTNGIFAVAKKHFLKLSVLS